MFQEKKIIISINIVRNSYKIKTENCPMNLASLEVIDVLPQQGSWTASQRQKAGETKMEELMENSI